MSTKALVLAIATIAPASYVLSDTPANEPVSGSQPGVERLAYACEMPACEPDCACQPASCCDGCCDTCDSCCRECCVASVERVQVEKHCWCVKTEKVCVPRVVCPWAEGGCGLTLFSFLKKDHRSACCDTCCDTCCGDGCGCFKPRCGKVKCVKRLEKKTYECEECVCKWEIRRLPPCCGDVCGCGDACGCEVGCE